MLIDRTYLKLKESPEIKKNRCTGCYFIENGDACNLWKRDRGYHRAVCSLENIIFIEDKGESMSITRKEIKLKSIGILQKCMKLIKNSLELILRKE